MSMFSRFFGGSKAGGGKEVTSAQAIEQLASVEEILLKKQAHLESQMNEEKTKAVKFSRDGNKRSALIAMKKAKKIEKNLLQIDGTLQTIDNQKEALHSAMDNVTVFGAMSKASQALKHNNSGLTADEVHDVMDELHEQHQIAEEIATAISSPVGFGEQYNDADLEDELNGLLQEDYAKDLTTIGDLPDVPITQPIDQKKEKDKHLLKELQEWAQ